MSKNLSAKYYEANEERQQKKAPERYQNLSKEEKEKNNDIVVNVTKISQIMNKINWLSTEKKYKKCLIFRLCKFEGAIFLKKVFKCIF